jgi:hypothetical protein
MSEEEMPKSSSSMRRIRLSDLINGRTMLLKSKATVDQATSDSLLVSTQDGGKCLAEMASSLSMKKER